MSILHVLIAGGALVLRGGAECAATYPVLTDTLLECMILDEKNQSSHLSAMLDM